MDVFPLWASEIHACISFCPLLPWHPSISLLHLQEEAKLSVSSMKGQCLQISNEKLWSVQGREQAGTCARPPDVWLCVLQHYAAPLSGQQLVGHTWTWLPKEANAVQVCYGNAVKGEFSGCRTCLLLMLWCFAIPFPVGCFAPHRFQWMISFSCRIG